MIYKQTICFKIKIVYFRIFIEIHQQTDKIFKDTLFLILFGQRKEK